MASQLTLIPLPPLKDRGLFHCILYSPLPVSFPFNLYLSRGVVLVFRSHCNLESWTSPVMDSSWMKWMVSDGMEWMQNTYNLRGMGAQTNKAGIGVQVFNVGRGSCGAGPL